MPRLEAGPRHNRLSVNDEDKLLEDILEQFEKVDDLRKQANDIAAQQRQRLRDAGMNVDGFNTARRVAKLDDDVARSEFIHWMGRSLKVRGVPIHGTLFDLDDPPVGPLDEVEQDAAE